MLSVLARCYEYRNMKTCRYSKSAVLAPSGNVANIPALELFTKFNPELDMPSSSG